MKKLNLLVLFFIPSLICFDKHYMEISFDNVFPETSFATTHKGVASILLFVDNYKMYDKSQDIEGITETFLNNMFDSLILLNYLINSIRSKNVRFLHEDLDYLNRFLIYIKETFNINVKRLNLKRIEGINFLFDEAIEQLKAIYQT